MKIKLNKTRRIQLLVATGFFLPLVALFMATLMTYATTRQMWDAFQWVPFLQKVESSLSDLRVSIENIEMGQRGYLLTGQEKFLEPYDKARRALPDQINQVRILTSEEPMLKVHVTRLESMISDKLQLSELIISLKRETKGEEAVRTVLADRSLQEIGDLLQKMRAAGSDIRSERELAAGAKARETERALTWLLVLDVLVISIVVVLLLHLRRLEKYVTMCAWSKTILDKNEWVAIDEYLRRTYDVKVSHGISEAEREKFMAKAGLPPIPPVRTAAASA